jgi:precorrin-2 methylase
MKLFCVGCGPGDPELLTVRAVNLIKNAEVIFAPTAREGKPSIALSVVEQYIDRPTKTVSLVFPMVKDRESLRDYWKRNADEIAGAVAVVPACYNMERVKKTANACDTVIFLKDGRYFDSVIEMLAQAGFPDNANIAIAQDVSEEGEILEMKRLSELRGKKGPTEKYFSIMVAKKNAGRE